MPSDCSDLGHNRSCIGSKPNSSPALRNLTLHKFRVLLNLLGVVFGVSSVIAMLAITEGARLNTERQFAALGAAEIIIQSVRPADDLGLSEQEE